MSGERDPDRNPSSSPAPPPATPRQPSEAPKATQASEPRPDAPPAPPPGALDGFGREPSESDWAIQTTARPLPKELLDAMKHPDVPGVVLDAITRRSTPAPGDVHPSVADSPDEDTARYNLGPAPTAAGGVGISKSTPSSPAPAQVSARREVEDSLATAWLVGIVFSGAVFAWLSFGLLGR